MYPTFRSHPSRCEGDPELEQFIAALPEVDAGAYDLEEIRKAVQADMNAIGGVLQKIKLHFGDEMKQST